MDRVCLLIADAIILFVTVYHTWGTVKASRQANVPSTIASTLLNDGTSMLNASNSRFHSYDSLYSQDFYTLRMSTVTSCSRHSFTVDLFLRTLLMVSLAYLIVQQITVGLLIIHRCDAYLPGPYSERSIFGGSTRAVCFNLVETQVTRY